MHGCVSATEAQLLSYKGDIFSYIQVIVKESLLELRRDFISFFLIACSRNLFVLLRNESLTQQWASDWEPLSSPTLPPLGFNKR